MLERIRFYGKDLNRTCHSQLNCSKYPFYHIHWKVPNIPNLLPHREKMAQDRKRTNVFGPERDRRKKIYNYRQWLERFKQHTKKKYETYIGPLIKEETMTETISNTEEEKMQQDFLWLLRGKTTHQRTRY